LVVLATAFDWHGSVLAVEDPGYPAVRAALTRVGVRWVPIDSRVPEEFVSQLAGLSEPVAAAYVTPSHQYPLGHRLDPGSRRDLLDWASRTSSMIIEDDYDGEFRFGVPPLPSFAGMDPRANVIYMGTMSKVLDPGLRLTYLRVPRHLSGPVAEARSDLGSTVAAPVQQFVTDLLVSGELTRHIARVRRIYADRRRILLEALKCVPAVQDVRGMDAGLHVVAVLRPDRHAAAIRGAARERGVLIADLDEYRATPDSSSPAIVLGYGKSTSSQIRTAIRTLADLPEIG
jgi:GntR family transcriptional regulator/MocR family aminotransferase